ncbi:MAG: bifunctional demethylmenaquinone methyltransferase/2-methoxy-6-polyprenyl-1,4-benzoquinol methylase UbiE [Syntrophales bacterium]|jgi:demethylmenaquinone methyltransferase/2-methoxy-6-polyprenyl-1,4-benzoquinol methylase|nr:bifunctional demethylmenaquinone methyltransferase/2-methoxy-6-polyprenyl-1,4-benzoquinol methylase UbiE [Syntrophales bacterium]MDY0044226.1 bifunctional demethylmenaquinone methyltransferase/2-methoxy-6-polyprenyl-1,4-benzoquinol methylase UbiE [Syntrophales bacterium]
MIDKKPKTIGVMFDRIAPTYDKVNTILSFGTDRLWRKTAIRHLGIKKDQKVLDVATGTGELASLVLSKVQCTITGVDLSREMLAIAEVKAKNRGFSDRLFFINGDALKLPFTEHTFDNAMVAFGLRNMMHIGDFLDEIYRVLIENGKMAILEFSLPANPLMRRIYLFYLKTLLPYIGGRVSGNSGAYRYLYESVFSFPPPGKLLALMHTHGFEITAMKPIFLGIAHLFILRKKAL